MPAQTSPHAERLSEESSGLPWFAVSEESIEDDDKLSEAGGESLFAGFAGGSQLGVVGGDDGVFLAGDQGRHEEGGAHDGAAAGNRASPAHRAAVAIDRRDTDQGGDLAAVGAAGLRQVAGHGAQRGPRRPRDPGS